jgi:hypothetical protein
MIKFIFKIEISDFKIEISDKACRFAVGLFLLVWFLSADSSLGRKSLGAAIQLLDLSDSEVLLTPTDENR